MARTELPNDPQWLKNAFRDLGVSEIAGKVANDRILEMFAKAGHPEITSDEVAWCAAAEGTWMEEANIKGTQSLAARSYLRFGKALDIDKKIPRGAVLIFKRGNSSWQGHVCNLLEDGGKTLTVIGGNQSNRVSVATYARAALIGARWPDTPSNSATLKNAAVVTASTAGGIGLGIAEVAQHADSAGDLVSNLSGFRIGQFILAAIALCCIGYIGYRFVWRHLRPAKQESYIEPAQGVAS